MNWEIINPCKSGGSWVAVLAMITKVETGEVREYITEEILREGDEYPNEFNWEEGNYSCDCNRDLFFLRAGGEDDSESFESYQCSDGKYSVDLINPVTGNTYYKESE